MASADWWVYPVKRPSPKASAKTKQAGRGLRLAAGRLAGKSVARMAREEGVSRVTASRAVNSPKTQMLITALVEQHRVEIGALFADALRVVRESMQAQKTTVVDGLVHDLGPDHYARLTGVKRLAEILTAGRQPVRPEAPRKTVTLEELLTLVQQQQKPGVTVQ